MIVMHATIPVAPEHRGTAISAASELAEQSRAEEGVVDYRVAIDVDDESILRFIEQYEDANAFEAHMESDHFLSFQGRMEEFLDGEVDLIQFQVADAEQLM